MSGGIEGGRPHFERTPQQSKPTEQHKPHLEVGNGSPALPPTIHERAEPPPESQASNTVVPRSREEQSKPTMRDVVLERLHRELARRREGQIYPATTDEGMLARFGQIEEVRKDVVAGLTLAERAQYEIEYLIETPLAPHKITMVESKPPELLDAMQQLDPKFMDPLITGLKKRPAREAKRAKALQRLFPNLNEEQIRQITAERAALHLERKVDRNLPPSER